MLPGKAIRGAAGRRHFMKLQRTLTIAAAAFLVTAAMFGQQVKTDYDRAANFGQYKTFSWEKVQTKNALWVDRIKTAVNTQLAAKGWTEVPAGGDVAGMAGGGSRNQTSLHTVFDRFGGGGGRARGGGGGPGAG